MIHIKNFVSLNCPRCKEYSFFYDKKQIFNITDYTFCITQNKNSKSVYNTYTIDKLQSFIITGKCDKCSTFIYEINFENDYVISYKTFSQNYYLINNDGSFKIDYYGHNKIFSCFLAPNILFDKINLLEELK